MSRILHARSKGAPLRRLLKSLAGLVVLIAGFAPSAPAFIEGATGLINSAADDGTENYVAIAGDGLGNWVAIWDPIDPALSPGYHWARSTDDGRTWSAQASFSTPIYGTIGLAVSGSATWLATIGPTAYRSTDQGATWSAVGTIPIVASGALATDGLGTWIVAGGIVHAGLGPDTEMSFSLSTDDGATWTPAAVVNNDAAGNFDEDLYPSIATDGAGRWVVVWDRGSDLAFVAATSDLGATWSDPDEVGVTFGGGSMHRLATDGNGRWIVAIDNDRHVIFVVSDDNAATWGVSQFLSVEPVPSPYSYRDAAVGTDRSGNWYIISHSEVPYGGLGRDYDTVLWRSSDNGDTWSGPIAASERAGGSATQGQTQHPVLAYDGQKSWILAWETRDAFGGPASDDDDDLAYVRWRDDCPQTPQPGCDSPAIPRQSKIAVRSSEDVRDDFKWKWRGGPEFAKTDFGTPTASTSYVACMYDQVGGVSRLVQELDAAAAATCSGEPCWLEQKAGFRYSDGGQTQGSIKSLKLRSGRRPKIALRGGGIRLSVPALPLQMDQAVTMQLINRATNRCWQAVFAIADSNEAEAFSARSQ